MTGFYTDYLPETGNVFLAIYVKAAADLGIPYEIVKRGQIAEFTQGDKKWQVICAATPLNNTIARTFAKRKNFGSLMLGRAGIPIPYQETIEDAEHAVRFFNENNKSIVIKPVVNYGGNGVSILPQTEEEVRKAFEIAYTNDKSVSKKTVLGETFAKGLNYRFLVLGDKVIGVARRLAATVTADGTCTIRELIERENEERKLRKHPRIKVDEELELVLKTQNLTLDTVPDSGERIQVRFNSNLTSGGTIEECADEAHEYYKELAVKATKALGLKFSGVDLIVEDITDPNSAHAINEVNANPGLRIHYHVSSGKTVDVALEIMRYMAEHM